MIVFRLLDHFLAKKTQENAEYTQFAYLHGVQRQPQIALVGSVMSVFHQLLSGGENTEMKAFSSEPLPHTTLRSDT